MLPIGLKRFSSRLAGNNLTCRKELGMSQIAPVIELRGIKARRPNYRFLADMPEKEALDIFKWGFKNG